MKKSCHILLLLCALTLTASPALGFCTHGSADADTTEDMALDDMAWEEEKGLATDKQVAKSSKSQLFAKATLKGAVVGVVSLHVGFLAILSLRSGVSTGFSEYRVEISKGLMEKDLKIFFAIQALAAGVGAGMACCLQVLSEVF